MNKMSTVIYEELIGKNICGPRRDPYLPIIGCNYRYIINEKGVAFYQDPAKTKDENKKYSYPPYRPKNPYTPRVREGVWFADEETQINWYTDPNFRSDRYHDVRMRYKEVNPRQGYDKNQNVKRASYIPYIVDNNGRIFWLLGSFHDFPEIKTDFGGKCNYDDKIYESSYGCAGRETNEETGGVLQKPIARVIEENKYKMFKNDKVRMFIGKNNKKQENTFIMVNVTNMLDEMDELNRKIQENVKEPQGPLGFYDENDIINGRYLTSVNLTDFITNIHNRRIKL